MIKPRGIQLENFKIPKIQNQGNKFFYFLFEILFN